MYHDTMNGVIIGRFMPPHNGHLYLFDFARHMVDTLYILVCTLAHEPIPGIQRFQWVRELAPDCRVIHITEEIPEARRDAAGATAIWARTVREAVPEGVTNVFASEEYGWELAAELGARFIPVDPGRNNIPVSATVIRRDPYRLWRYIPPVVRPYFVKHVAVVGSPGTTARLAEELGTVVVHSYRAFWHATMGEGRAIGTAEAPGTTDSVRTADEDATIRRGIVATARALARQANRILLYDISRPRDLSEIETVNALVCDPAERESAIALIPERPVFDAASVTGEELENALLGRVGSARFGS